MTRGGRQLGLFGAEEAQAVGPAEVPEDTVRLAARLPRRLRLGTSSWSFPGWAGLVYDREVTAKVLAREGLAAYMQYPLFRTVGVDRTYYAPMATHELRDFAVLAPEGFRFLSKAHEECVLPRFPDRPRYGRKRGDVCPRFFDAGYTRDLVVQPFVEGLGDHAGPLLFQLPPVPADVVGGPHRFAERLHRFLHDLPRGPLYAVELRTPELLGPVYLEALADVGAVHTVNAWPGMPPVAVQAEHASLERGPALVVRWLLHRDLTYESAKARFDPFDTLAAPDPQTRSAVADLAHAALDREQDVFVIVNNKAEGSSPLTVAALAEAIVSSEPREPPA